MSKAIYVELDCLLDTRLGTLFRINKKNTINLIMNNYNQRFIDVFPGYDTNEYNELYAKRDRKTLLVSPSTPLIFFIEKYVDSLIDKIYTTPIIDIPKLVINTYPYNLTDREINIIISGIAAVSAKKIEITTIRKEIKELTPVVLNNNYIIVFMYEYRLWLEHYSENEVLNMVTCPDVTMYGPQLVYDENIQSTELEEGFKTIENFTRAVIDLQLLPVGYFSCSLEIDK